MPETKYHPEIDISETHYMGVLLYLFEGKHITYAEFMYVLARLSLLRYTNVAKIVGPSIILYRDGLHLTINSFTDDQYKNIADVVRQKDTGSTRGISAAQNLMRYAKKYIGMEELVYAILQEMI